MSTTKPSRTAERGPVTLSAMDAASFLLVTQDRTSDELITHLKLQKLLYYAQGYHLALFGSPLFSDEIRAWKHGPVVRDVYATFKANGKKPLKVPTKAATLPDTGVEVLTHVLRSYGQFSAWRLREMTHAERPWLSAKGGSISQHSMTSFFRAVLARPLPPPPTIGSASVDPAFKEALDRGIADVAGGRRIKWGGTGQSSPST